MTTVNYHDIYWMSEQDLPVEALREWARQIERENPYEPHRHGPFTVAMIETAKRGDGVLVCPGCNRHLLVPR
jgi:hypothetical protein